MLNRNKVVEVEMRKSNQIFFNIVLPQIKNILKGNIYSIECSNKDGVKEKLDMEAGFDFILSQPNKCINGIANRVQYIKPGKNPFNTFTVRYKLESGRPTEYQKRKYAIKHECLYPKYTIQSYVEKGTNKLLSCSIARTKDIIDFIDKGFSIDGKTGKNQLDNTEFKIIPWSKLFFTGYPIKSIYNYKNELCA